MSRASFPHQLIRASAGSGKTHQLTNRYLGLLAAGVAPDAILATTFTRKAAGEILDRVLYRLARAAASAKDARDLAGDIAAPGAGKREFAAMLRDLLRQLHRVRISTLDSFYISLAGSFSLELGLPAGWTIGEEADDEALRQDAVETLLEREQADILVPLYDRLTCGMTKRSVAGELLSIVRELYAIQQETSPEVWHGVTASPPLAEAPWRALLERIEAFDLSGDARMDRARFDDLARIADAQWQHMLTTGLCGKVFCGENCYFSEPIPEALITLYSQLIDHLRSLLVQPLADQNRATRDFLDRFHRELWTLKKSTGLLRFQEVTQAVVNALDRQALAADALAFRLDAAIEHLLLDEFQDTSLAQWKVLQPLAQRLTRAPAGALRSFFCVGDVKQAIYAWRGGMPEIFAHLPDSLDHLQIRELTDSRRSAPPIIDAVNAVFGKLGEFDAPQVCRAGVAAWAARFVRHTTHQKSMPGYACLHTGPKQQDNERVADHRARHCRFVAGKIRDLARQTPGATIGVLCRKKDTLARLMYELRLNNVEASEESGNPLTDSPAVEHILSLCTLADHPGHSIAWFHLQHSPLREHLERFPDPFSLSSHLRRELQAHGYGAFVKQWCERLAPACDRRDLGRLQQLIEAAFDYQPRGTLRARDFVAWVRQLAVQDPTSARVRVMTIHAAKGLEFDVVVLPELDPCLTPQPPAFIVGRDNALNVEFVCRYAEKSVRQLLAREQQQAFEQDCQRRVEESLSLLYVAMTRPKHALWMFIPGPRQGRSNRQDAWYHLLLRGLASEKIWLEHKTLFELGDGNWFEKVESATHVVPAPTLATPKIEFCPALKERQRGLEHIAPSRREGGARVLTDRLFHPAERAGMAEGTLFHAWFETIKWLDDGDPTDEELRAVAEKKRWELPNAIWRDLDKLLARFRTWLANPQLRGILTRSAYSDRKPLAIAKLEIERRFLVPDRDKLWNGAIDRIVWLGDGSRIAAAEVLDFKTDDIPPGDSKALADRVEFYRPQIEAYRDAVARFGKVPRDCITARLVFPMAGRVVPVE